MAWLPTLSDEKREKVAAPQERSGVVPIGEPGDVKRIVPAAGVEEPAAGVVGAPGEEAGAEVEVAVRFISEKL